MAVKLKTNMVSNDFQKKLEAAVPSLLELARDLTTNKISNNCKFILSEIRDSEKNLFEQIKLKKVENDNKVPKSLHELMPRIQEFYENFYDINLHIYKATEDLTIIDIRYYPKSSLKRDFRLQVTNNPPMLHCKVSIPPGHFDKNKKFDINWEHNIR
jgi:hypothetical protein